MTIQEFAAKYRVRIRRDGCDEPIIPGWRRMPNRVEYRNHICDNGDGRLGVCLIFLTIRSYNIARRRLVDAGFVEIQRGDTEGILLFDSGNEKQARMALAACRIKTIRVPSAAQQAVLDRLNSPARGPSGSK